MSSLKQLKQLVNEAESLQIISKSLGEVAAVRLNRIKANVERNRTFFNEITQIYTMVKIIAKQKGIYTPNNGKTISVLLTSNSQFSGKINSSLTNYFVKNTLNLETDRVVVGKTGQQHLKRMASDLPCQMVSFEEDLPSYQELKNLADSVRNYKRILIYYSKLESMLSQKPFVTDITATADSIKVPVKELSYIFEPEVEVVLGFFDTQINILLLEQTLLESELSRVANRLVSMSEAEKRAAIFLSEQKSLLSVSQRSLYNLRLLQSIISQVRFRGGQNG